MPKRVNKFIPPRRFAVPLVGLVIAVSAIAQRAQPVLSKQIARLQATPSEVSDEQPNYNLMEENSGVNPESFSKEARLRKVLDSSSRSATVPVSTGKTYTWIERGTPVNSGEAIQELEEVSTSQPRIYEDKASIKGAIPRTNFPQNDGVFLYGSSPKAGEFGKGYIVFEKQRGKVVGAMYMPSSEFNCFQGTLDTQGEIAMSVKGFAGDVNPNQVASIDRLPSVGDEELTNYAYAVTLQDYYQLDNIGNNDRQILKTCKANFQ